MIASRLKVDTNKSTSQNGCDYMGPTYKYNIQRTNTKITQYVTIMDNLNDGP